MKVAAYQAPLDATRSLAVLDVIREQIDRCESNGVDILCCPEVAIGGLADYAADPFEFALDVDSGQLQAALAPLASDRVTTIVGFTEIAERGLLFNSAAVFSRGSVAGLYRKLHPAINRSVYQAGARTPTFTVGGLTFGILICRDSTFVEPAQRMAAAGATVLFVPTNNGLPPAKGGPELVDEARACDVARATENGVFVVRADVAGRSAGLVAYGSSAIVRPDASVAQAAAPLAPGLIVGDVAAKPFRANGVCVR